MSDLYLSRFRSWLLASPPAEFVLSQLRELIIGALGKGPIPQHVAFIMDGNRRYARSHKIETIEGHNRGFEALARILDICYKCGVKAVTVYAFSTENFSRPKYEVDGLMQLAKVKLAQLSEHGELLDRYGASVRILGERDRIPQDVLEVCDRAVEMTKNNSDAILNICFPYTSREEMTAAIRSTVAEYSSPPRPQNTPFSQTRISQKIRSKNLEVVSEAPSPPMDPVPDRDLSSSPSPLPSSSPPSSSSRSSRSDGDADQDDSISTSTSLYADSSPPSSSSYPSHHHHVHNQHAHQHSYKLQEKDLGQGQGQGQGKGPMLSVVQSPEAITTETLDGHLYTAGCPPLDLLVRTSGVTRLSDFMLWQCHEDTHISFLDCYWPEFDLWQFIPVVLEWQWRKKQKAREEGPNVRRRTATTNMTTTRTATTMNADGDGRGNQRDKMHVE